MVSTSYYQLNAEIARQQRLAQQITQAQNQISTNSRLLAPSDDPSASARVTDISREQANGTVWTANARSAAATASQSDAALTSIANSLTNALELMTSGTTATLNHTDRAAIATQLRGLASTISMAMSQTDSSGNPLFPDASTKIPVGNGMLVTASPPASAVFDGIASGTGTSDMVSILNAAADALSLTDPDARATAAATSLDAVKAANARISTMQGEQGVMSAQINSAISRLQDTSTALSVEQTTLQNTDIPSTVANLQALMLSLQAAQATFAKVNQQGLFSMIT